MSEGINMNGFDESDFDLVPTVEVGLDGGVFSAEVIELYELPFEKVMKALGTTHGPAQMMAMLEIFKLAVVDQTKLTALDILSFNELADLLGQWAALSTPPVVAGASEISEVKPRKLIKHVKIDIDNDSEDPEVQRMIDAVLNPETSLEELMEIAQFLSEDGTDIPEPPQRGGRHALPYNEEDDIF